MILPGRPPASPPRRSGPRTRWREAVANEDGMTLLEILVVMVIIGLLATLGSVQLMGYLGRAKTDTARLQIKELATALDLYRIDVGRVPTTEEGIASLLQAPQGSERWAGPYLSRKTALLDPWGRPYRYTAPGERGDYDLVSLGADGRPGGEGENRDIAIADDR
ncbi:type II secretion system major pseudopilin GspG [Methylorubrum thiocyanatum]|uniref:type II secretion system major pseudopilin GspG n=1 Tax=Methylorubrum thiocyanatum TaxID=47958 RepID=UPI003F803013